MKLRKMIISEENRDTLIASRDFNFNGIAYFFLLQYSFDDGELHIIENHTDMRASIST